MARRWNRRFWVDDFSRRARGRGRCRHGCPPVGARRDDVEIFVLGVAGSRDDSVANARISAAILRAITTTGELRLGLGANREFMVRSSGPSHFLQMKGQDGQQSVVGNYFVRVVQIREEATTIVTGVGS